MPYCCSLIHSYLMGDVASVPSYLIYIDYFGCSNSLVLGGFSMVLMSTHYGVFSLDSWDIYFIFGSGLGVKYQALTYLHVYLIADFLGCLWFVVPEIRFELCLGLHHDDTITYYLRYTPIIDLSYMAYLYLFAKVINSCLLIIRNFFSCSCMLRDLWYMFAINAGLCCCFTMHFINFYLNYIVITHLICPCLACYFSIFSSMYNWIVSWVCCYIFINFGRLGGVKVHTITINFGYSYNIFLSCCWLSVSRIICDWKVRLYYNDDGTTNDFYFLSFPSPITSAINSALLSSLICI
ncbi:hypothetical protein KFK09_014915 [Dendrobium nobile]|uniref:Uncharacterized protein n=1 Tax=Dendrobium nobile TaxID=94219 RepID=A0A8T3B4E8_DENNO|nr:hypothetical protein KFK09_014915 [Dendrobium nobile]